MIFQKSIFIAELPAACRRAVARAVGLYLVAEKLYFDFFYQ